MKRRTLVAGLAAALAATAGLSSRAQGNVWRIISPFAPGGAREIPARAINQELGAELKETIIVDNKPGAGGAMGTSYVGHADPDGHTMLIAASSHFTTAAMGAKPTYDPVKDFAPVAEIGTQSYVLLISAEIPAKTVAEFIAYAKNQPGKLNYGSAGIGSSTHLAMAYFCTVAGIEMVHVPYKSTQFAANDVIANLAQATIVPTAGVAAYANNPKMRVLGVTSKQKSSLLPDVPAIAQSGLPNYVFESWFGLLVPAGTPKATIERINAAVVKVLGMPAVKERLATQGILPTPISVAEFTKVFMADKALMGKIIKDSKIVAQ
jgi:tripartite-type tricarboxylate transporter receptor subunit TctC